MRDFGRPARHDLAITVLFAAAVLVIVDQALKALAGRMLADGRFYAIGLGSGFRRVRNQRGGLVAISVLWAAVIWIASVAGVALALTLAPPTVGAGAALGVGLVIGGATSNLADRVLRGTVLDFIVVGPWPTFNVADAAMMAGVALLVGEAL